jgi:chitinase
VVPAFSLLILLLAGNAFAAQISLAWDPNTEPDLAGYRVHIGDSSGVYHTTVDVGNVSSVIVSGLQDGRVYYFVLTAYDTNGTESDFSEEVSGTPTEPPPPPPPADTTAPAVSITSPQNLGVVSGTVTVTASASDNVGVAGVQFRVDGAPLGAEDTTAPYSVAWNTSGALAGTHRLTAVARDAAGNTRTSAEVIVSVVPPLVP